MISDFKLLILFAWISVFIPVLVAVESSVAIGNDASPKDFSFMASLMDPEGNHQCAAVLVTPSQLLCAARCLLANDTTEYHPDGYVAVAGVGKLDSLEGRQERFVILFQAHQDFDFEHGLSDLGLVTVEEPFVPSIHTGIAIFPYKSPVLTPEKTCTVVGWAKLFEAYPNYILQKVDVKIIDNSNCSSLYVVVPSTDRVKCFGLPERRKFSAADDRGGPLLCNDPGDQGYHIKNSKDWKRQGWNQRREAGRRPVGIVSQIDANPDKNLTMAFTDVYNYVEWINAVIIEERNSPGKMSSSNHVKIPPHEVLIATLSSHCVSKLISP